MREPKFVRFIYLILVFCTQYILFADSTEIKFKVVNYPDLFLNEEPSMKSAHICKVRFNKDVIGFWEDAVEDTVDGDIDKWYLVRYDDKEGYAWGKYLIVEEIKNCEVISGGVIVEEPGYLREKADTNSGIIKKLDFGTVFYVLEKRTFYEENEGKKRRFYWYRAKLIDNSEGWIISKEGIEGYFWEEALQNKNYGGLYYSVATTASWGYRRYKAAEKLLKYILSNYKGKKIPIRYEMSGGVAMDDAVLVTTKTLANTYKYMEEYEKAIKQLRYIYESTEFDSKERAEALWNILKIYNEDIEYPKTLIELCHEAIEKYNNLDIGGYEGNLWVDIYAAEVLVNVFSSPEKTDSLMIECRKILSESSNPPVILIANYGIVRFYIKNDSLDLAKKTVIDVINKYPSAIRTYFKTDKNFAVYLLSGAVKTIIDFYGDYNMALEFVKEIKNNIQEEEIIKFSDYITATLLDEGNGDREEVLLSYEQVSDLRLYDPFDKIQITPYQRIKQIKSYKIEKIFLTDDVEMKSNLKSKPQSDVFLPKGTIGEILYEDKEILRIDEKRGKLAKIKTTDGKIGWVFGGFLSPLKEKPLFTPMSDKEQIWSMEGGDITRSSAMNEETIKKPVLISIIHDISNREVVFSDVNKDKVLDIIAYSSEGLTTVDGITKNIIWTFKCSNGSIPIVDDNIIYIIAYKDEDEYLFALNKSTANVMWEILLDRGMFRYPPSSPAINNNIIYVGTPHRGILAIELTAGKVLWEFPVGYPVVGAVTAVDNLVFFASREKANGNDELFALDAYTGQLKWKFDFILKGRRSLPYLTGVTYAKYFEEISGNFILRLWHKIRRQSLLKGVVFCVGSDGYMYAIDAETGESIWKTYVGSEYGFNRPATYKGVVYYAASDKKVFALDSKTGEIKWESVCSDRIYGTPAITNDALYVRTVDNYIHAISLSDGELLWKFKIGSSNYWGTYSPSIAQGLIFVGSKDNNLYVIGEEKKQ